MDHIVSLSGESVTVGYNEVIEQNMVNLYESLSEKDRRRYAAIEAEKQPPLRHRVHCNTVWLRSKTIRRGTREVGQLPEDMAADRIWKTWAAGELLAIVSRNSLRRSGKKLKRKQRACW